jgi:site-specific DNA recombinase
MHDTVHPPLDPSAELISAVGYLRMSSGEQIGSIEQQESEIERFAAQQGYRIIRWYIEPGRSGSKEQNKRIEFNRMILDSELQDFRAVLCWDVSRFGRLDNIRGAHSKDILRTNGVHLATVKEGKLDWTTFEGRLMDALYSETAHKFSIDLSANSIRGRIEALEAGYWPNGMVPYGYDKLYIGNGVEQRVPRREKFTKPRNWVRHLVINEAEVVRWIFDNYLNHDWPVLAITRELDRKGIVRPDGRPGRPWETAVVRHMLRRKVYAGFATIGCGRQRRKEAFHRAGRHEKAGAVPAIIDLETWGAVQQKAAKCPQGPGPRHRSGPLQGVLFCGHCGHALVMQRFHKRGKDYIYYRCASATARPGLGCKQWRVEEKEMLPVIVRKLVTEIDRSVLDRLRVAPDQPEPQPELDQMKRRLDELKRSIERGKVNYLAATEELRSDLETVLMDWRREAEELERRIQNLSIGEGLMSKFAAWWEEQKGRLVRVAPAHHRVLGSRPAEGDLDGLCSPDRDLDTKLHDMIDDVAALTLGDGATMYTNRRSGDDVVEMVQESAAIIAQGDELRAFLKVIGLKVTLYWVRHPRNRRLWALDRGRMDACLAFNLDGAPPSNTRR